MTTGAAIRPDEHIRTGRNSSADARSVVQPLGERLRADTRDAHLRAERAFDLDNRLTSVTAYGDALLVLDAFARTCAPVLTLVAPFLPAVLRDGPARRRARLAADLRRLGRVSQEVAPPPGLAGVDRALGVWYVQEGAALGGLMIAAEVRRRLPEAIPATTFFAGEGRLTARRWRLAQQVLAAWAPGDRPAHDRVVVGALEAFTVLTATMAATPPAEAVA